MATFKVSGIKEVKRAFEELGRKAGSKAVRSAVRSGVKIIRDEVKRTIPEDTGQLKKAVKVRVIPKLKRGVIGLEVRIGEGDFQGETFYGAFQEFGTLRMPGKRFMTKAFEAKKVEVKARIISEIVHAIFRGMKK